MRDLKQEDGSGFPDEGERLPYEPPRIERLGPISELTAFGGSGTGDPAYGGFNTTS